MTKKKKYTIQFNGTGTSREILMHLNGLRDSIIGSEPDEMLIGANKYKEFNITVQQYVEPEVYVVKLSADSKKATKIISLNGYLAVYIKRSKKIIGYTKKEASKKASLFNGEIVKWTGSNKSLYKML